MKDKNSKWYAIRNPMWLSDTFVCAKIKDYDKFCYVKLNLRNEIEEIGVDAEYRLHGAKLEDMTRFYEPITRVRKMRFNSIGDEYWWEKIREYERKHYGK